MAERRVGSFPGVLAHYARHRWLDGEGTGSRRATRALGHWLRGLQPDIVHLQCLHDHWLNLPALTQALSAIDAPVVMTLHDAWMLTGGCPFPCSEWPDGCAACRLHPRSPRALEMRQRLRDALGDRLHIVGVSQWITGLARQSLWRQCDMRTIPNGVDTSLFRPLTPKAPRPLILGVAWPWTPRKGLDDMLRMRSLLPREGYDMRLIGLSRSQIRRLPPGIEGLGRVGDPVQLARHYSEARVLCGASRAESFGMALAEAVACGTPVAAYDNTAVGELVVPSTGLLVPDGDVEALARAVRSLADNPIDPLTLHSHIEAAFSQPRMTQACLRLYEMLNA